MNTAGIILLIIVIICFALTVYKHMYKDSVGIEFPVSVLFAGAIGFALVVGLENYKKEGIVKDYINGKTKIEIIYKKQEVLKDGFKDTILIPVDTILVDDKKK
mgnify:CR=1 FL=1